MTEQIKNCNTCANATEDFNNDIDNGCYMCSKGIENNYEPNVAEQIKSAVADFQEWIDRAEEFVPDIESDHVKAMKLAIRSLNAWKEVLKELEENRQFDNSLGEMESASALGMAINIIKQKLAEIEE